MTALSEISDIIKFQRKERIIMKVYYGLNVFDAISTIIQNVQAEELSITTYVISDVMHTLMLLVQFIRVNHFMTKFYNR